MSYQHFHHWGVRTKENIERLIAGTDYGSSYTNANQLLEDGQSVIDKTIEGFMNWSNNTSTDGSGNYYGGCFMAPSFSQYFCDTTEFTNKWFYVGGSSTVNTVRLGATTAAAAESMIGISYNTLFGAGDFAQMRVCGIAYVDVDDFSTPENGHYVDEGQSAGKVGDAGGTVQQQVFAWCTNNSTSSEGSGSIYIKINATETS